LADASSTSSLGPTIFVGLSLYVLATGSPVPPPENPAERMDMADLARAAAPAPTAPDETAPNVAVTPQTLARNPAPPPPVRTVADLAHAALAVPPRISVFIPGADPAPGLFDPGAAPRLPSGTPTPRRHAAPVPPVRTAPAEPGPTRPAAAPPPAPATTLTPLAAQIPDPAPPRLPAPDPVQPLPAPVALAPPAPPPQPLFLSVPAALPVTVTGDRVHLRRAPNTGSQVFTRFDTGAAGEVLETRGNWSRVHFPDHDPPLTGWMFSRYLQERPATP